jgi:hypothetical protein
MTQTSNDLFIGEETRNQKAGVDRLEKTLEIGGF